MYYIYNDIYIIYIHITSLFIVKGYEFLPPFGYCNNVVINVNVQYLFKGYQMMCSILWGIHSEWKLLGYMEILYSIT